METTLKFKMAAFWVKIVVLRLDTDTRGVILLLVAATKRRVILIFSFIIIFTRMSTLEFQHPHVSFNEKFYIKTVKNHSNDNCF